MAITTTNYGQLLRLICPLTVNAVATDASTVTLTVHPPQGADSTYTLAAAQVVRDSTGTYHYDLTCNQGGMWYYTWITSSPTAAYQGQFYVNPAIP